MLNQPRSDSKVQPKTANLGPKLRTAPEGPEKLCTRCNEWWPADGEFFQPNAAGAGGLFYCCKACYAEWRTDRRKRGLRAT